MSSESAEVKNTNGGGYASSSDEEETKGGTPRGTEGFRKDGEPEYKPRKASSSSDSSESSADGADDIDDSSSESRVAQKRSIKSESSQEARRHSSSSDTDDNQDELLSEDDEDEVMKSKLEEDKKLDILNDNQELSKEEIELSKRQTIAIEDKVEEEELSSQKQLDREVILKEVAVEEKVTEVNSNAVVVEAADSSDDKLKKTISISSEEEGPIVLPDASEPLKEASPAPEEEPESLPTSPLCKSSSVSEEELIAAPVSPKRLMSSSSSEDEFSHHKKKESEEEEIIHEMKSSSSEDDFVHINEKDVMKSPSSTSEDSVKGVLPVKEEEEETQKPSPAVEVSRSCAPPVSTNGQSDKVVLRAETPERVISSPKPPTSPKPSHIPRVNNNNNGDITKIYTEALSSTNDSENNNSKNAPKQPGVNNRSKPSRDITEIYKNSILAKEATPPSSPRTPRNKPAKAITSLYTDKIDKPVLTSPSEKLCPKKHNMATSVEKDDIRRAYEDVRSDTSDTDWAVFKFEGNKLGVTATGNDFNEFKSCFGNEDRGFGYIRIMTGDEMSKRSKFVLVTWVGPQVSVMKKAKMSTDKALMKDVIQNLSVELQLESHFEFNHDHFKHEVDRASGARYGTGVRDL